MVVLGAVDVDRAIRFWSAALDYRPVPLPESDNDFTILVPRSLGGVPLGIQRADSSPEHHPRVHLDLSAANADEQRVEVERLVDLGAARVDWDAYPDNPDFVVLEDTEGNRFCVVDESHH